MVKVSSERQKQRNALARARMAKMKEIMMKDASVRTAQEQAVVQRAEDNRRRKNERARQRLQENQSRMDRILATPEEERSKVDQEFLEKSMSTRERKIICDRERRKLLSLAGTSTLRDAELMGIPVEKGAPQSLPKVLDVNKRAAEYLSKISNHRKENRDDRESARGNSTADDGRIHAAYRSDYPPTVPFGAMSYPAPYPAPYYAAGEGFAAFTPSGPPSWGALSYPYPYPPPSTAPVECVTQGNDMQHNIEMV
jgi:hypothetical protein